MTQSPRHKFSTVKNTFKAAGDSNDFLYVGEQRISLKRGVNCTHADTIGLI